MNLTKDNIQDNYLNILEQLEQEPGGERALNSLIKLESSIKEVVFGILENYKEQGIDIDKTKISNAINGKVSSLRSELEARIMQIFTGDKTSINNLLDQFVDKINDVLGSNKNIDDVIKEMKITFHKIEDTILPPDELDININSGTGEKKFEQKKGFNKFALLIELLRDRGVYTDDLYVVKGINKKNQMRQESYLYIHIPRINKTILLNNGYGEKTFIYDGYIDVDYFTESTKNDIKQDQNINLLNFDYKNTDNWKNNMKYYLFEKPVEGNFGEKQLKEKIDIKEFSNKLIKENIIKHFKEKGDINFWKNLVVTKRRKIKILGNGLTLVSSKFGLEGNPIGNNNDWYDLLEEIYGEKIERLSKENIIKHFKEKGDINFWKNLSNRERNKIKFLGNGLISISREFGLKGNPIGNNNDWYDLLEAIYGEKIEIINS